MTKWHKGPPPSVGWWPASAMGDFEILRWWNGKHWSMPASRSIPIEEVESSANKKASGGNAGIRWSDRPADWPERSRT